MFFLALILHVTDIAAAPPGLQDRVKIIEALLQKQVDAHVYPGLAVSIVYKNQVLIERGFGYANIEWEAEASADTVFEIGSITKSFTGIAIAQLVGAGSLSLDDPIEKFMSDYPLSAKQVKIRHLLNHTSGIPNFTRIPAVYKHMHPEATRDEVVAWFKDLPLNFIPEEQFEYSNSGIYLLGIIIETVSGCSYGEYIEKNILKPFGMHRSGFQNHRKIIPNRAQGYMLVNNSMANAPDFNPMLSFSAGGLLSTAQDMQKFMSAIHATSGKLTPFIQKQIFHETSLKNGNFPNYTLGCLRVSELGGHKKYWHSGETIAFSSHFAYYPSDDLSIVVLTNRIASAPTPLSLEREIARVVLGIKPSKILE